MAYRKKLIEVSLPLEAINRESAREKSLRHGHPSTLHLWWSRKPLATARAVLFASLVDDPGNDLPPDAAAKERKRLHRLIEQLVKWENAHDETVLHEARLEIARSIAREKGLALPDPPTPGAVRAFLAEHAPPVLDPFAGGGSIPLEAQRLGLMPLASDLNPVAVLLNKALIEIPPRFAGRPPVNPEARRRLADGDWKGATGLAEDILYYSRWMRDEAEKRIGHLYPKVRLPEEQGGGEATVIAWLWARTVRCPNPACGAEMPLTSSFWLSKRKGNEAWIEPVVDRTQNPPAVRFVVRTGHGAPREGTVNRRGATCLCCGSPVTFPYIRGEGKAGRMGARLMAIVAEGARGRMYLEPDSVQEQLLETIKPDWKPDAPLPRNPRDFKTPNYGLTTYAHLFTSRQLVALNTFSDLLDEVEEQVRAAAVAAGWADDNVPLREGGSGAQAYAEAVRVYLALVINRLADRSSTICRWDSSRDTVSNTFARQAIPMVWDYAEANPFSNSSGNWMGAVEWVGKVLERLPINCLGETVQADAATAIPNGRPFVVSTDPPYYDNIGYADLSDFFYVWLRRNLRAIFPDLFATVLVPKAEELVATPYRFGGDKEAAKRHFEEGLRHAFRLMRQRAHPDYPMTLYYAFKQQEHNDVEENEGEDGVTVASTGWESMLNALLNEGYHITATWPMRTEMVNRSVAQNTNALASSIVLALRPRPEDAPVVPRRTFLSQLRWELAEALQTLKSGNIAPVDLAQALIGPGMAVFSRFKQVLEADGSPMTVRTALGLINQVLDELLAEQEGDYDADTRWALAWFEQYGYREGPYGDAETLAVAKNTSVKGLEEAGILEARAGKVRLKKREEYRDEWDPEADTRLALWEAVHYVAQALERRGEEAAAALLARLGARADGVRELAYRLYTLCDRKQLAADALAFNLLVTLWPRLKEKAGSLTTSTTGSLW